MRGRTRQTLLGVSLSSYASSRKNHTALSRDITRGPVEESQILRDVLLGGQIVVEHHILRKVGNRGWDPVHWENKIEGEFQEHLDAHPKPQVEMD